MTRERDRPKRRTGNIEKSSLIHKYTAGDHICVFNDTLEDNIEKEKYELRNLISSKR